MGLLESKEEDESDERGIDKKPGKDSTWNFHHETQSHAVKGGHRTCSSAASHWCSDEMDTIAHELTFAENLVHSHKHNFKRAQDHVKEFGDKLDPACLATLNAYRQQAINGDAEGDEPWDFFQPRARKIWDDWAQLRGMSKEQAMDAYVKLADKSIYEARLHERRDRYEKMMA
mmetsp:Transcript_128801/g.223353  ORF Transcript_128801/g.223353 Transcript_128801/m.223353 type:complete len:173 (-) Transcript_128801:79-597(-)